MSEFQRTMIFVVLAAVSVVGARFAGPSAPKPGADVSDIGAPFFPDFTDAEAAKSLEVITYNPETASVKPFAIVQDKTGLWCIPYAHNYPADGKERLAKTAASMIGIKREGFAGRRESEHADFGVLDPKSEVATDLKGIGNRITLKDGDGTVLADYIIGKEVKGRSGMRYVRRPDEKATYIAKLDIQVSTKFADWIESDLLKIEGSRLNMIAIDTTTVDADKRAVIDGEMNRLTRKLSSDPWKMDGIDEAVEEPNQPEVTKLVSSLDELKIVGVRKKPARLMQGLRDDKGLQLDQITVLDLDAKGFFLVRSQKGGAYRLIPKDGNVIAVTDQGVAYDLKFGDIFNGTETQVEVGFAAKEEGKEDSEKTNGEKKDEEGKPDDTKKEDSKSLQKSRYLFVTVHFDAEGLGPKPVAPTKPELPSDTPVAGAEDAPADATAPTNTAEDPKKVYEAALSKYDEDAKRYGEDLKLREEKVKAGEKLVKELNARFADWYYVVSGNSFENLRQGRKTLVKEKSAQAPPANPGFPGGLPPGLNFPPQRN